MIVATVFLFKWMEYDRGDSFLFNFVPKWNSIRFKIERKPVTTIIRFVTARKAVLDLAEKIKFCSGGYFFRLFWKFYNDQAYSRPRDFCIWGPFERAPWNWLEYHGRYLERGVSKLGSNYAERSEPLGQQPMENIPVWFSGRFRIFSLHFVP